MSDIVIVGGGHAGGQAAASLRQEGFEGRITLVGEEPYPPYHRPPLSKQYLAGEQGLAKLPLRPERFYADKGIDLRLSARVTGLDPHRRQLSMDDGGALRYEQLLLATGSRARRLPVPGDDLAGVHYLRNIADVDAIRRDFHPGQKLVVVGGGYIGLEVAAVAVSAGLDVQVLEMEDRVLARVTTPWLSNWYQALHESRGVRIRVGARVSEFGGKGQLQAVHCGAESFAADLAIVGVGVLANSELAQEAGIDCDNGILVDDTCRTSAPGVWAAGDCTNHPNALLGRRLRLESVPNAMEQARVAAANLCGKQRQYAAWPWFWSDQYELKLQMVGFSADGDLEIRRGDPSQDAFAVFHLQGERLVAVDAVNSPREFMVCRRLIGQVVDADALADPGCDLKALL